MSARAMHRFVEMIGLFNRGKFLERVDEHLRVGAETLEALPEEKGEFTLTLTVKFQYDSGAYKITPTVKSKLPDEKAFAGTTFWAHDGGFSLQHPSQIDMFVRGVEAPHSERGAG